MFIRMGEEKFKIQVDLGSDGGDVKTNRSSRHRAKVLFKEKSNGTYNLDECQFSSIVNSLFAEVRRR